MHVGGSGAGADGGARGLVARRAQVTVASGAALVLIAFVFDAAPLFVPGVALVLLGAILPPWVWASAHGARVRRVLSVDRVVEGEPLTARIEITRSRLRLGLPGAEVFDPLSGRRLSVAGASRGSRRGRTTTIEVRGRLERRGEHVLAPPSLDATDPLGLARIHVDGTGSTDTVLVLPRTERVRWVRPPGTLTADRADGDAAGEARAATELDGLRPYRPGTPASRIHWPALARGHGLIERRLLADGDRRPLLVLDGRHHDHESGRAALDAAVRAAASLVLELARGGGCGLILPGDQRATVIDAELLAWPSAHARLAIAGAEGQVPAPRIPTGARHGALIYVSAMGDRVAAGLARSHPGTVLVVPAAGERGGRPADTASAAVVLEVAGCHGFQLRQRARAATGARAAAGGWR